MQYPETCHQTVPSWGDGTHDKPKGRVTAQPDVALGSRRGLASFYWENPREKCYENTGFECGVCIDGRSQMMAVGRESDCRGMGGLSAWNLLSAGVTAGNRPTRIMVNHAATRAWLTIAPSIRRGGGTYPITSACEASSLHVLVVLVEHGL